MTNKNKLKVLVGVLLFFIVVLVVLLIYAKSTFNKSDNPANSTISTTTQSASNSSEVKETIDIKLYYFDADDYENVKEIRTVAIDKKLYQDDIATAINEVLSSTNIKINKATINGQAITVDMPKEMAQKFNSGSAGGITYTNILATTILNLPDIEKLEVTVDGVAGVVADHFDFNGTFTKAEGDKKYTFTKSDKKSNEL